MRKGGTMEKVRLVAFVLAGALLLALAGCHSAQQIAFDTARTKNSIEGWQHYLAQYPSSTEAPQAKAALSRLQQEQETRQLQDERAWREALTANTVDAYRKYLASSKSPGHGEEAANAIRRYLYAEMCRILGTDNPRVFPGSQLPKETVPWDALKEALGPRLYLMGEAYLATVVTNAGATTSFGYSGVKADVRNGSVGSKYAWTGLKVEIPLPQSECRLILLQDPVQPFTFSESRTYKNGAIVDRTFNGFSGVGVLILVDPAGAKAYAFTEKSKVSYIKPQPGESVPKSMLTPMEELAEAKKAYERLSKTTSSTEMDERARQEVAAWVAQAEGVKDDAPKAAILYKQAASRLASAAVAARRRALAASGISTGKVDSIEEASTKRAYHLYVPTMYNPNLAYPLVVTAHGGGPATDAKAERDLWADVAEKYGLLVCSPDLDSARQELEIPKDQVAPALLSDEKAVLAIIKECRGRYNINQDAVIMTGCDAGAYAAHYIGLQHPEIFRCIVGRCGSFNDHLVTDDVAMRARHLHVYCFYGEKDLAGVVDYSRAANFWYTVRGFRNFVIRAMPGDHDPNPLEAARYFLNIINHWPAVHIKATTLQGQAPLTVTFEARVHDPDAPDGRVESVLWNFGDNFVSAKPEVTHTYAKPGLYNVFLTMTDLDGHREYQQAWIEVNK
jgi:enterochelin esterase-like enzyme